MNSPHKKMRAILLSALMVASIAGGGIVVADGSVVGTDSDVDRIQSLETNADSENMTADENNSAVTRPQDAEMPSNATVNLSDYTSVQTSVSSSQLYTVIATNASAVNATKLDEFGEVQTQTGRLVELQMSPSAQRDVSMLPWVEQVRRAAKPVPANVAGGGAVSSLGVEQLHERGVTGDEVRVGVIDIGFDTDAPGIADNVVDQRYFADPGPSDHGTAVAQVVTRTAPDASLYLATTQSPTSVSAALNYFTEQDVDIVVMSLGYPMLGDDGQHVLTQPIANARANGVMFINSAGNSRQKHWEGEFTDTDEDGYHEFNSNGNERQCTPSCTVTAPSGSFTTVLDWEREGDGSEYRIGLYDSSTESVFEVSTERYQTLDDNRQFIGTQISQRPVDIVIAHTGGPANDKLELNTFSRELQDPVGRSSIGAPADVPAAVSVAAYVRADERTARYSSVGPTDDGRIAPTVTGYTNIGVQRYNGAFAGTSAAAPHVAGVAALVEGATPEDQSPRELSGTLETTADDISVSGRDIVSGTGVVNASAAVRTATNRPPTADAGPNQTVIAGETVTLNGTGSSDPDGDSLDYQWRQLTGPSVSLQNSETATPNFTTPTVNTKTSLTFEANVEDGIETTDASTDRVTVTVTPASSAQSVNASRKFASSSVQPGETVAVTINVEAETNSDDLRITETINPALPADRIAIVADGGATIATYSDSTGEIVASYGSTNTAGLGYEFIVPENASEGDTFTLSGTATDGTTDENTVIGGSNAVIEVTEQGLAEYRNEAGIVDSTGVLDAAADFRNGEIDSSILLEVAVEFRNR